MFRKPPRWAIGAALAAALVLLAAGGAVAVLRHPASRADAPHPATAEMTASPAGTPAEASPTPLTEPSPETMLEPAPPSPPPPPSSGPVVLWTPAPGHPTPDGSSLAGIVYDPAQGYVLMANQQDGHPVTWRWDGSGWSELATGPLLGAMAFDPDLQMVVALSNDASGTVLYGWTGTRWAAEPGSVPTVTNTNQRLVYDPSRRQLILLLLGDSDFRSTSSAYAYSGGGWSPVGQSGPSLKASAAAGYDPSSQRVLIYGGCGQGGYCSSALWAWKDGTWAQLTTATTPPAGGASFAGDPGGLAMALWDAQHPDTFWRWTGSDWSQVAESNAPTTGWGYLAFDAGAGVFRFIAGALGPSTTWTVQDGTWTKVA